jgi:predicted SAM-dependent methyltransferase
MRVLNVGGGSTALPDKYKDWDVDLLDIDETVSPILCMDARDLARLSGDSYDGVFCSHNLEHFAPHEVPGVLQGFLHVLKPMMVFKTPIPDLNLKGLT